MSKIIQKILSYIFSGIVLAAVVYLNIKLGLPMVIFTVFLFLILCPIWLDSINKKYGFTKKKGGKK